MKKLYILWSIWILLASGCTSALNVTPENSVTFENFFKTEEDLEASLNSAKIAFREYIALSITGNTQEMKGMFADKLQGYGLGFKASYAKMLDAALLHTPNAASCIWKMYYYVITQAQVAKEYVDRSNLSEEKKNYYKGQASFYEAYTYFLIAQNWGDAVIVEKSDDVGEKGREPWQKVVQFALDRTEDAIRWLPEYKDLKKKDGSAETSREIACKEVAYCLKAYICAWKASLNNEPALFTEAINATTEVIKKNDYYSLAGSPEEVCTSVLVGGNKTETIFEIPLVGYWGEVASTNFSMIEAFLTYPIKPEALPGDIQNADAQIFYTTVDKMYPKGDLRREAYFYEVDKWKDDPKAAGCAYPYKYRKVRTGIKGDDIGKYVNLDQNRIIYRLADILLLRAECYARLGQDELAKADLKEVRDRSHAAPYPASTDEGDLRYVIFKERNKELLWEFGRYYDYVRNGYWKEISPQFANLTDKQVEDGALYLPVGFDAYTLNPMVKQNKYWLSRW